MSVSTLSSSTSTLATQALTSGNTRRHGGPLDAAAKALGLSKDDLISQLKSGKSLDDIATAQGVSHDTLAAAIKADMPSDLASSANVDTLIDKITSKKGMPDRPQGPPPATDSTSTSSTSSTGTGVYGSSLTDDQKNTLQALSSLLGTDSDSLLTSLQNGTSLSDLLTAGNVDQTAVAQVLQNGLLFDATT